MDDKEILFFIGKCLNLSVHPEQEVEIRNILQTKDVTWETFVWIGSNHLVLPAIYVQFRNFKLLNELPEDLVSYLEEIYQLNVKRNLAIKNEALNIISTLNSINIAPIFLKGTAHLLNGLYSDIGERMIGDIDFLVAEKEILPAAEKLKRQYYFDPHNVDEIIFRRSKHYPRLQNENAVAAVEIHRQPVSKPYDREFNYNTITRDKKRLNIEGEAYVLSDHDQIIHNMMNAQMNDNAFKSRKILLRNIYDLLLLAKRNNPLETAIKFGHYSKQFNAYLIVASKVLGETDQIKYIDDASAKRYYRRLLFFIDHPRLHLSIKIIHYLLFRLGRYIKLPFIALFDKTERKALIWRLSNGSWYIAHLKSWYNIHI